MKRISIGFSVVLAVLVLILAVGLIQAGGLQRPHRGSQSPLGTGFTYQGQLMKDDLPLNGTCDVAFRLYDAASGGDQVGSAITTTVTISNGLLTTDLNFGAGAFTGSARWLGLAVQCPGDASFTVFGERHRVMTPTVGIQAMGIAFDGASMWVASGGNDNISILRVSDGARIQTISIVDPHNIAFDGVYMWITREPADIVSRR